MVPVCNRQQENFKCFRYNDIPGDYLGSLDSLDSGAKGDLRKVWIGVRVRARDSFQKQTTPEPATRSNTNILGRNHSVRQILIFWNHSVKSKNHSPVKYCYPLSITVYCNKNNKNNKNNNYYN
jgi:hypothetical protein